MDMNDAAVFLASSILLALGSIVIISAILIVNNLIAKYWKSWGWKIAALDDSLVRTVPKIESAKTDSNIDPVQK